MHHPPRFLSHLYPSHNPPNLSQNIQKKEAFREQDLSDADFVVPSEFVDPLKELFKAPKTKGGWHRDFVNDVFMVKQRVASNDILPISRKMAVAKNASRKCLFCNQKFLNRSLKFNEHVASHLICYRCPNEDCTSKDENGRNKLFARPGSNRDTALARENQSRFACQ